MKALDLAVRFSMALGCFVSYADAQTLRTVALSGTEAPGVENGETFTGFNVIPALNNAGQTTFRGFLNVAFSEDAGIGIWSEGGGAGLALVALAGNPAPLDAAPNTVGDEIFSRRFLDPTINSAGQTAFRGGLIGSGVTSSNNRSLWSEGGTAGLGLVAREGNPAPGTTENFSSISSSVSAPVFNGAGQSAFFGLLPTGLASNNSGIWSEGGGAGLALLARGGNAAPNIGGGVNFGTFRDPVINSAGQTAFWAFLTGPGVGDNSVWSEGDAEAGLALIARQGDMAPGTTGGASFSNFGEPVINNAGQTAFEASLDGAGSGIWLVGGGGGLAPVTLSGNVAPGVTDAATFSDFSDPVLNGAGQTAFRANLTGTGLGIWAEEGEAGLTLVARTGNQAPGAIAGATFSDFSNPTLNGAGQVAFRGTLTGTDVNSGNDRGIWAEDASGVLTLIAREGDEIDVDDGPGIDLRTIAALSFAGGTGNEDGRRSEFNDLGQLAFMIQFTDGTDGVFVSDLATGVSGDFDDDNDVDGADFLRWQRGRSPSPLSAADLEDWEANFGTSLPAAVIATGTTVVPEPSSCVLLLLGMFALLGRLGVNTG